jgi:hypothetical protein
MIVRSFTLIFVVSHALLIPDLACVVMIHEGSGIMEVLSRYLRGETQKIYRNL